MAEKTKAELEMLAKLLYGRLPTSPVEDRTGEPPEPLLPERGETRGLRAAYGQWVDEEAARHRAEPASQIQADAGYLDVPGGKKVTVYNKVRKK
jgi:hypothetical protein